MIYNDLYNAEIFSDMFRDQIKWCKPIGGWMIFDGKKWKADRNDYIKKYSILTYKKLIEDLKEFHGTPVQQQAFANHIKHTGHSSRLDAMLTCSKAELSEDPFNFDTHRHLFNCNNGTLDLKNAIFKPDNIIFNPAHLLTKITKVDFDSKAKCPLWMKFLHDIFLGKSDLIDFVQRAVGYSMCDSVREQCMFILHGDGRNGKSIFLETLRSIFGEYSFNLPDNTLVKNKVSSGVPNDVAAMKGTRFVTAAETEQNVCLNESLVKRLTGSDQVTARRLYQDFFEFQSTSKIFLSTNHRPNIRGTDNGIWRRIKMIPFDFTVTDTGDDKMLKSKLRNEFSGILTWAFRGYRKWLAEGLNTPDIVKQRTDEYRNEEDDIGRFIQDCCVVDPGSKLIVDEFKERFLNHVRYHKSQKVISQYMRRRGFDIRRITSVGKNRRYYIGIRFLTESEMPYNNIEPDDEW